MPDAPVIVWCSKLCLSGSRAGKFPQIVIPSLIFFQAFIIIQFRIHRHRWIEALKTHLYRVDSIKGKYIHKFQSDLCLLFYTEIPAPSSWYLWIFYFRPRLTLYKWVFSASIQRPRLIRNWTILCQAISNYWEGEGLGFGDFFKFPTRDRLLLPSLLLLLLLLLLLESLHSFFLAIMAQNALSIRITEESFVCLGPNPNPHPFLPFLVKENVTQSSLAEGFFQKYIYLRWVNVCLILPSLLLRFLSDEMWTFWCILVIYRKFR